MVIGNFRYSMKFHVSENCILTSAFNVQSNFLGSKKNDDIFDPLTFNLIDTPIVQCLIFVFITFFPQEKFTQNTTIVRNSISRSIFSFATFRVRKQKRISVLRPTEGFLVAADCFIIYLKFNVDKTIDSMIILSYVRCHFLNGESLKVSFEYFISLYTFCVVFTGRKINNFLR